MQGGAGPPFQNPPLFVILGAPSAPPFGPACSAWRSREDGFRRPGGALASGDTLLAPPPSRGRLGGGTESLGERRQRRFDPAALRLQPGGQPELLAQVLGRLVQREARGVGRDLEED